MFVSIFREKNGTQVMLYTYKANLKARRQFEMITIGFRLQIVFLYTCVFAVFVYLCCVLFLWVYECTLIELESTRGDSKTF